MQRTFAWKRRELGQLTQRKVHFSRRAADTEIADLLNELIREILALDELQKAALRIGRREDDLRLELVTIFERNAGGPSILHDDLSHGCARANIGAQCARRAGDRGGHAAVAVLGEAPGAERAIDLA